MTTKRRQKRVSDFIHQAIGELLLKGIKDPRVENVTITDVEITADLRQATVWYSVLGDEEEVKEAAKGLESASGFLRSEVGGQLNIYHTPELVFKRDRSWERGARIDAILEKIAQERIEREDDADTDKDQDTDS
jgi:ribosome-binding factor A